MCWQGIDGFTIYDVVHAFKIPGLEELDVLYLKDVPDDYPLSTRDRTNVDRINNEATDIDKSGVEEMLGKLEYPIYFLDFESVSVAVPIFDGNHPWEKVATVLGFYPFYCCFLIMTWAFLFLSILKLIIYWSFSLKDS